MFHNGGKRAVSESECMCRTCAERPKSKDGEPMVYRLKDWPSGEEFMALMPSRYTHPSPGSQCYTSDCSLLK